MNYQKAKIDVYDVEIADINDFFQAQIFYIQTKFYATIISKSKPEFELEVGLFEQIADAKQGVIDFILSRLFYVQNR
ncbi:MAG: hypothetical protein OHK0045_22910 [Raineya sp.]